VQIGKAEHLHEWPGLKNRFNNTVNQTIAGMSANSLHTFAAAVPVSPAVLGYPSRLLLAEKSSVPAESASPDKSSHDYKLRIKVTTKAVRDIYGYTHGGIND
jgi:hypothetical protein